MSAPLLANQSNVISLSRHAPASTRAGRYAALTQGFARNRRFEEDVFWLKENAELLNIFECTRAVTGAQIPPNALEAYAPFYEGLEERFRFFPQYYRFLVSIALDLEDLGLPGTTAETLCARIRDNDLVAAELSDLQRAEACRLLARRGMAPAGTDGLDARLRRFIGHSATFSLPNRKAAYELTHIVFYLSEYGRRDPQLCAGALRALEFTGTLAHLEENTDLLAEVCIALRYAGAPVPAAWQSWVEQSLGHYAVCGPDAGQGDDYHAYLVSQWACALAEGRAFSGAYHAQGTGFYGPAPEFGALRALSCALYEMGSRRSGDWDMMGAELRDAMPPQVAAHIDSVRAASPCFEAFFAGFSRAPARSTPQLQAVLS